MAFNGDDKSQNSEEIALESFGSDQQLGANALYLRDEPSSGDWKKSFGLVVLSLVLLGLIIVFSQRTWLAHFVPKSQIDRFSLDIPIDVVQKPLHSANSQRYLADNNQSGQEAPSALRQGGEEATQGGIAAQGTQETGGQEAQGNASVILDRFDQLLRLADISNPNEDDPSHVWKHSRDSRLFFISVREDGVLELKGALHKVYFDQAPLTRTLERLLEGPSPQEINNGLHSLIPRTSSLLSAKLEGDTAYLNFNQSFLDEVKIREVLGASVKQVVFTVTEFPNIKRVRLLVEGQPILGTPIDLNRDLSRDDVWDF